MTVELLPCSQCRKLPVQQIFGAAIVCQCGAYEGMRFGDSRETARARWNVRHGYPLTLAERPQDAPALDVPDDDEPAAGDGVLVVRTPTRATCVSGRWRSCGGEA